MSALSVILIIVAIILFLVLIGVIIWLLVSHKKCPESASLKPEYRVNRAPVAQNIGEYSTVKKVY